MSADILQFPSKQNIDEAWETYAELARKVGDDPSLLANRTFMQEFARRQGRWIKLFGDQG